MKTNTVALVFAPNGDVKVLASAGVTVLAISEHTPNDRVYCYAPSDDGLLIERLIGSSPIGHAHDGGGWSPRPKPSLRLVE